MVGAVKRHILQQRTKFRKDRSNRYGDIAIFVKWPTVAAVVILNFQKFKILTLDPLLGANVRHRAKFHKDRSNRYRDITIFVIFQDGGRRHFGF